ncbi:MAG: anthranilate synthase component I family protein [Phycisphaerales bacterium]
MLRRQLLELHQDVPVGAFRGASWVVGETSDCEVLESSGAGDAAGWLRGLEQVDLPTLACLTYDLGSVLEPAASCAGKAIGQSDRRWPLAFRAALKTEGSERRGTKSGSTSDVSREFRVGTPRSNASQEAFEHAVERALEYIRAGDIYQVNLAHRFSAPFRGCPRAFFAALAEVADPAHGAYMEYSRGDEAFVVASASPELFLDFDGASRTLRTRPMKGTRPAHADTRGDLLASAKDQAELAMIVDLMRNDLGKVCDLASVRVEQARRLETHGSGDATLFQTTATVAGSLRANASWSDILAATFPGGSITGAPKIRAMQIIEELETHRGETIARRGPYCGSIGLWMPAPSYSATLNIAIRTACVTGTRASGTVSQMVDGVVDWWVGAGIVADSNPGEEWRETLAKAGVFMRVLRG